jgi:hypothetical protein
MVAAAWPPRDLAGTSSVTSLITVVEGTKVLLPTTKVVPLDLATTSSVEATVQVRTMAKVVSPGGHLSPTVCEDNLDSTCGVPTPMERYLPAYLLCTPMECPFRSALHQGVGWRCLMYMVDQDAERGRGRRSGTTYGNTVDHYELLELVSSFTTFFPLCTMLCSVCLYFVSVK